MKPGHKIPLAAIVHGDGNVDDADVLLAGFSRALQRDGWQVGGVVQLRKPRAMGAKKSMHLVDVRSGEEFSISQDLGPESRSCCIDPVGVATASRVLRQALADRVDLVAVNRFGALEAAGGGFAGELLALLSEEIPVLTIVAPKHLAHWHDFTGGLATPLPPTMAALHAWFTQVVEQRTREQERHAE